MKELELLKEDWEKKTNDHKDYSEMDIQKMIRQKSVSATKSLFIIGLLEIILWFAIGYINGEFPYLRIALFALFFTLIIYLFNKIRISQNSVLLMRSILNLRKTVLGYATISFLLMVYDNIVNFKRDTQDFMAGYLDGRRGGDFNSTSPDSLHPELANYIVFAIALILVVFFLYWIYKKTYGEILANLKKNYQELS